MNGDFALQISQDETMGKYLVLSASDMTIDDLVKLGRFIGVIE